MSSTVWPSGHGCLSLKSMFTLLTAGRATRQDLCVCARVCLCAVDELLKPLDTACNTLHLSSLRLHGKDNEKCVFLCVYFYGAV